MEGGSGGGSSRAGGDGEASAPFAVARHLVSAGRRAAAVFARREGARVTRPMAGGERPLARVVSTGGKTRVIHRQPARGGARSLGRGGRRAPLPGEVCTWGDEGGGRLRRPQPRIEEKQRRGRARPRFSFFLRLMA